MRQCARVAGLADRLADIGNPNLITDVGVSAILAEAACAAARLNVEVNLKYLKDDDLAQSTRDEMDDLTQTATDGRGSVAGKVARHLTK
jgi:formiminotetrahydrofolate cyclodeaminase